MENVSVEAKSALVTMLEGFTPWLWNYLKIHNALKMSVIHVFLEFPVTLK